MLRISKLTDYSIVVLSGMARDASRVYNAAQLAGEANIAPPTVSKILKGLARAGLLVSYRGANGGYRLARAPGEISVAEIIDAMEGPISLTECGEAVGICEQEPVCSVRGHWQWINHAIRVALESVTLADMTRSGESHTVALQDFRQRMSELRPGPGRPHGGVA